MSTTSSTPAPVTIAAKVSGACAPWPTVSSSIGSVALPFERPLDVASGVSLGDGAPLVVGPLAARHGQVDLDPAVFEEGPQRDERHAPLAGCPRQLVDL